MKSAALIAALCAAFAGLLFHAAPANAGDTEDLRLALARLEANISRCRPKGVQLWFQRLRLLAASPIHGEQVRLLIQRYEPRAQAVENDDKKISMMLAALDLVSLRRKLTASCDLAEQRAALAALESSLKKLDLSSSCAHSPRVTSLRDLIQQGRKAILRAEAERALHKETLERNQADWDKVLAEAQPAVQGERAISRAEAERLRQKLEEIINIAEAHKFGLNSECGGSSPLDSYVKAARELRAKLEAAEINVATAGAAAAASSPDMLVPNVVAMHLDEARAALQRAGLTAVLRGGDSAPTRDKALRVQLQSPEPGADLPANRQITLVVFGPHNPPLVVPRVTDIEVEAAGEILTTMGFKVAIDSSSGAGGPIVEAQRPGPGQYLSAGSEIILRTKPRPPAEEYETGSSD